MILLGKDLFITIRDLWQEITGTIRYLKHNPTITLPTMDYDAYWQARGYHQLQPRFKLFAQNIEPGSTVLDIGCGDGFTLEYLTKQCQIIGLGIDLSAEAVRLAQTRGVEAQVADILSWEINQSFDYIILSEVLEHVTNPEIILQKVALHCNKAILISIPNIGYYRHRLRLLSGYFPVQWKWHPSEHVRFWTVSDFVRWINQSGLHVAKVSSSNGFPLLHQMWPNLFSNQAVFIVRVKK